MHSGGDGDDQTEVEAAAEPTEMAGVAEAETMSAYAWSEGDVPEIDPEPVSRWPAWITAGAVTVSLVVITSAVWVAAPYLRGAAPTPIPPLSPAAVAPVVPPNAAPPSPPSPPLQTSPPVPELVGVDARFIAEMRRYGVPVSDQDPQWTVNRAHAVCDTAHDGGPARYPPGTWLVIKFTEAVMINNPEWTRQQASRFTNGAFTYYCPDAYGRSQQEIAALPPYERYLAVIQDRLGVVPVDDSLMTSGRQMCTWKSQGWTITQIVEATNSPLSADEKNVIARTAIDVLCPQYR